MRFLRCFTLVRERYSVADVIKLTNECCKYTKVIKQKEIYAEKY